MSKFRCFDLNRKASLTQYSSDRISNLRNKTIYSDLVKHKDNKKNGTTHKNPFVLGGCGGSSGPNNQRYLRYAPSHQDLLNVTKGAFMNNPICTLSGCPIAGCATGCSYDIQEGIFLTTIYDTSNHVLVYPSLAPGNVGTVYAASANTIIPDISFCDDTCADLSTNFPGVWVDPSNYYFTPPCEYGNNFIQNTTICGETRKDFTYLQRAKTDILHGFSYPRCLKMSISGCC